MLHNCYYVKYVGPLLISFVDSVREELFFGFGSLLLLLFQHQEMVY